uniref:Cytochrome P450 n=1 Tax=Arion vulgaris TaxID=1028688 RepID=A0A0B7BI40_9EUPU
MAFEFLVPDDNVRSMIAVGVVTVVAVVLLTKLFRFIRFVRHFQNIPGVPNYSILYGNLHMLPKTGEGRIAFGRRNMETINPRLTRMWWGPFRPNLAVFHPDTVKAVLKSSAPKSRGFGHVYEHVLPWIGEGLIASNGATWARSRRLLTPAFHFDILKPYVDIYNKAADTLFEKLDQYAETGESFDICPLMTMCTLEVILKCSMSYDEDVQRKGPNAYAQAAKELLTLWSKRNRTMGMWPDFLFRLSSAGRTFYKNCDYVHKVAEEIIEKRRQLIEKDGRPKGRHLDFLDILLTARDEDGNPMTTQEIRNEVDTFMFAGHDTTATGTPWIIYSLAKSQEYQTKVQAEIDEILEGRDTNSIEWSDLAKLNTLQICIKEAMRLYPPVPFIQRTLNEPIELDGRLIPAGINITIAIIHLHRNPLVWDAPDEFRPDRFLPENMKDKDSFSFTPFSAGSRNCIGQNFALNEEKVLIGRIFQRYDVTVAPDGPPVLRSATAILKSDNGLWFRLKKRQI